MVKVKKIITDRLILDPLTIDDIEAIYELAKDKKSIEDFQYVANSVEDVKAWLEPSLNDQSVFTWAIRENDVLVGMIEAEQGAEYSDITTNICRIGYFIDHKRQNKGFGSEAIQAVIDWLFNNTEINRIEAGVTLHNIPSYRVLEKVGFIRDKIVKSNWKWYDQVYDSAYYYLLKPEPN